MGLRVQSLSLAWLLLSGVTFAQGTTNTNSSPITLEAAKQAERLMGLDFSDAKLEMLLPGLRNQLQDYAALRAFPISNAVPPALQFNPIPLGMEFDRKRRKQRFAPPGVVHLPQYSNDLAFYSIGELGALIKTRKISSVALTQFFLDRLKRLGPKLECVVTLTEERALAQARRADAEIAAGKYRGPLHGIPYGAKDLLATRGTRTTWGAPNFTNQVFDFDATVVRRLEDAGAVLICKTTLGELAMGETWFGGKTRNPWKLEEGSSGSSAGSCAATAAGLLPFAIGSETLGSIVSPSDRCGVTGLRPTFGRVSRSGAMNLSWSMDKLGPLCRSAEDCALVFSAIYGPDGMDQSVQDLPFNYDYRVKLNDLRIGYFKADFDSEKGARKTNGLTALERMTMLGAKLEAVTLPDYPVERLSFLLSTEAAAAFEVLTRTGEDDLLRQQERGSWPNTFRRRRFVPAVEYINSQRVRWLLIQDMAALFSKYDVIIAPPFAGKCLLTSNLTGHPCVVLPNGFTEEGTPTSICFIGKLFDEATLLAAAKRYQEATDFSKRHPKLE